jgi:hypothetical protein
MKRPQEAVALALVHRVRTSTDLAVPRLSVSAVSRICGPIYLQCEQLHFKFVVNQSRDSRSARYSRDVFAETSSHRRLDQLIQISYLRSAGVNGAVNLLGTTSLTVQETVRFAGPRCIL